MATKEQIREKFVTAGFSNLLDELESQLKHAIRVVAHQPVDEAQLPLGASKFGGLPDLPPNTEWPHWEGRPLHFVSQIAMVDVKQYDLDNVLPEKGILYFFYDMEQPWGYDPADRGRWKVTYFAGNLDEIKRTSGPATLQDMWFLVPRPLEFVHTYSLPSIELQSFNDESLLTIGSLRFDFEPNNELLGEIYKDLWPQPIHQLLGYPSPVQESDMEVQCQLASNGIMSGDGSYRLDPRGPSLIASATSEWRLLCQFDTDEYFLWGDTGMIYFWIKDQDLQAKNFENVWLVLQCC